MRKSHVKELMEKRGLTLRALSDQAGFAQVTLVKARSDEDLFKCRLDTVLRLAAALGVDVKDLYTDDPDQGPADSIQAKEGPFLAQ